MEKINRRSFMKMCGITIAAPSAFLNAKIGCRELSHQQYPSNSRWSFSYESWMEMIKRDIEWRNAPAVVKEKIKDLFLEHIEKKYSLQYQGRWAPLDPYKENSILEEFPDFETFVKEKINQISQALDLNI